MKKQAFFKQRQKAARKDKTFRAVFLFQNHILMRAQHFYVDFFASVYYTFVQNCIMEEIL